MVIIFSNLCNSRQLCLFIFQILYLRLRKSMNKYHKKNILPISRQIFTISPVNPYIFLFESECSHLKKKTIDITKFRSYKGGRWPRFPAKIQRFLDIMFEIPAKKFHDSRPQPINGFSTLSFKFPPKFHDSLS